MSNYGAGFWTREKIGELEALWVGGKSQTLCAEALGCTKNMVAGKIYRMRLSRSSQKPTEAKVPRTPVRRKLTAAEVAARRAPKPPEKIIRGDQIPPLLDNILQLRSTLCAYPYGEQKAHQFCGRKRERGAFCEPHASLCYEKPKSRLKFNHRSFR